MSCPTCGPYPSSPDDPVPATPLALCDPDAVAAKATVGKLLGSAWADTLPADKVVILARYGERLARLMGDGYVVVEKGVARLVTKVALQVGEPWVTYERPGPRAAVVGNPPPFDFMVAVNAEGECFALPGRTNEDSLPVWSFTNKRWEIVPTSNFPICIKDKLNGSGGLELIGFEPLDPNDEEFVNTQRCVKGFCGAGLLIAESQPAPGECFRCEEPVECGTTVVRALSLPAFEATSNPVSVYGMVFSEVTGPAFREIEITGGSGTEGPQGVPGVVGPQGLPGNPGAPGAPGAPGQTGPRGTDGVAGPAGGPIGPAGPIGPQGIPGPQGPQGIPGSTGATGAAGSNGHDGVAGPQGPSGASVGFSNPTESDLAKLSTRVQTLERHVDTVLVSVTPAAASTGPSTYAVQSITGVTMPSLTNLVSIDAMLLQVIGDSVDPQQDEAGTHNLIVAANATEALRGEFTFAGTMGVAGVFPRLDTIRINSEVLVPWTGTTTNGNLALTITNTKFATLPAGSVIPKYSGSSHVKVYLKGFLVTRKVVPVFTP